jgi:hypothetical protein
MEHLVHALGVFEDGFRTGLGLGQRGGAPNHLGRHADHAQRASKVVHQGRDDLLAQRGHGHHVGRDTLADGALDRGVDDLQLRRVKVHAMALHDIEQRASEQLVLGNDRLGVVVRQPGAFAAMLGLQGGAGNSVNSWVALE